MKLSDLFTSFNKPNDRKGKIESKSDPAATEKLNRQIRALTPGKQLQGEVISKNGNEVKIKLPGDLIMNARLEQDVNVEEGQLLTFEVKNNGTSLYLSPLFANTAASDTILKALQMAQLPIQNTTVNMTEIMMQQGLGIDSKSLQGVFKDFMLHQGAEMSDVVALHKLGLPVDENNLQQMQNYRELTHQLVNGMTDVLEEFSDVFSNVLAQDGEQQAVILYQGLLEAVFTEAAEGELQDNTIFFKGTVENGNNADAAGAESAGEAGNTGNAENTENAEQTAAENANGAENINVAENAGSADGAKALLAALQNEGITDLPAGSENSVITTLLSELSEKNPDAQSLLTQLQNGEADLREVFHFLAKLSLTENSGFTGKLAEAFKDKDFTELLKAEVFKQWSLKPEEGFDGKTVNKVYNKLYRQLASIQEVLQNGGAADSAAMKSTVNLSRNLDFMNQINEIYQYVQLPLKMQNGQKNGELYVYTNKKSLAAKDGVISALLHLDMEHLGPVDVYVAMQNERVNTRFTVGDDELLLFLNDHMHILTERLQKKGYQMKCEMTVRDEAEAEKTPIDRILQTDKNHTVLLQYGFDVRA